MGCDLETQDPLALARLLDIDEKSAGGWTAQELEQVLQHQLSAPLLFDLAGMYHGQPAMDTTTQAGGQPSSFGELFSHPRPPKELLQLVKEFAKTSDQRENSPLPPEISTILYYAAILSARLRLGQRISTLSDDSLRNGIEWALGQTWLGEIRELFEEGRGQVGA